MSSFFSMVSGLVVIIAVFATAAYVAYKLEDISEVKYVVALFLAVAVLLGFHSCSHDEGYDAGYKQGVDEGRKSGYEAGFEKGKSSEHIQGYSEGYEEGYLEGYMNGAHVKNEEALFYKTYSGYCYHEDGCYYLESKIPITAQDAKREGLRPCSGCIPQSSEYHP